MAIAIAVVLFIVACVCLYGAFHAALSDAGPFVLAALLLAAVNISGGVLNVVGASSSLSIAIGVVLCVYAFIAFVFAILMWDGGLESEDPLATAGSILAFLVLTTSAVFQFAVVA